MSESDAEQSNPIGRLKRYANVTSAVGGLAARVAGERYLGIKIDRENHAKALGEVLGDLKGPLMKVAQILSTIPDALPQEYREELSKLQADAPSMGWLFVKRRMTSELGQDWLGKFKDFEKQCSSAASLGQVHKATSLAGEKLACKLQYPDMQSAIEADLKQLKLAFNFYERADKAISTKSIHKELSARLAEELDYKREAANLKLYSELLKSEKNVLVPEVYEHLSTERLLTMTWLEGEKITSWLEKNPEKKSRNNVAINMFKAWYIPFYFYGVIHGDPHLGNYSITKNESINLLDFGSIRFFNPSFVEGVIILYEALKTENSKLAEEAYFKWGFGNLNKEMISILSLWARFLYAPLLNDSTDPISQLRDGKEGREVASKVHQQLKKIGGVEPPREFVLMDRAAIGLGSVFMRLQAKVNWHRIFEDMIEEFDLKKLSINQSKISKQVGINIDSLE